MQYKTKINFNNIVIVQIPIGRKHSINDSKIGDAFAWLHYVVVHKVL